MKIKYDNEVFDVRLEDDGTLDTVLSVNGYTVRFDSEYARNEDGQIYTHIIYEAIEAILPTH